jgi:hypothetical protein
MTLPFDMISIARAEGAQSVSLAEFLAMPLDERVRLIMEKRLQFFAGDAPVDRGIGLRGLMSAARQRPLTQ